jgi:DNA-binding transcriptional LysR family regulator
VHPDLLRKPILDSRKLLAFATLARCGSFTQTARELFLTQSAVSHAIKSLEGELECRLFDRLGRKARLTLAGQHLLEYADRILNEMQHARSDLKAMDTRGDSRTPGIWQTLAGG